MTVACVLRSGGDYGPEWVYALRRGLNRWLPDHNFRCLTDVPAIPAAIAEPLVHRWPGWWSKIELFRPGLFEGPVLYLDLDTLVVGDLSGIASYRGPFAMLADFYAAKRGRKQGESGVMAWTPGNHTEAIYRAYCDNPITRGGDGPFIRRHVKHEYLQDLYPGQLTSLKVHAPPRTSNGPPEGARLVCGHGRPRFNTAAAGWAHDWWQAA